jgi:hypothetical protein
MFGFQNETYIMYLLFLATHVLRVEHIYNRIHCYIFFSHCTVECFCVRPYSRTEFVESPLIWVLIKKLLL